MYHEFSVTFDGKKYVKLSRKVPMIGAPSYLSVRITSIFCADSAIFCLVAKSLRSDQLGPQNHWSFWPFSKKYSPMGSPMKPVPPYLCAEYYERVGSWRDVPSIWKWPASSLAAWSGIWCFKRTVDKLVLVSNDIRLVLQSILSNDCLEFFDQRKFKKPLDTQRNLWSWSALLHSIPLEW